MPLKLYMILAKSDPSKVIYAIASRIPPPDLLHVLKAQAPEVATPDRLLLEVRVTPEQQGDHPEALRMLAEHGDADVVVERMPQDAVLAIMTPELADRAFPDAVRIA